MRFSELMRRVEGRVAVAQVRAGNDPEINGVCEDSRKVRAGNLFVARNGTKVSGAQFVKDAVAKGAVAVVAAEAMELPAEAVSARVEDANQAMALLAHEVAGNPTAGMKMLAVTGTKGKTTVAYLLRSILKAAGRKCGLIGTVQIDDGERTVDADMTTPGAVELVELFSRMRANAVGCCVMETSSHALHQHRLAGIDFAVGMFTNLTGDHLDYHKTMDEYAVAKALLFAGLAPNATAVINADDAYAKQMVANCKSRIVRYGLGSGVDWSAEIASMTSVGMELRISGSRGIHAWLRSPLVGRHNVYNTLCALAGARGLDVPMEAIIAGLQEMHGVPGRLEPVVGKAGSREAMPFQVLVDYAHTHDAMENVLTAVRATMGNGRLICVFGCGGDRDRTKRPKMAAVAEKLADRVIVTSDNPRTEDPAAIIGEIRAGFSAGANGKVLIEADRHAAIAKAIAEADSGDVVLIAGKGHENYQIIGTTKHHFDDVEEAQAALAQRGI